MLGDTLPGMFPKIQREGLHIAPVKTPTSWMVGIQCDQSDALTPRERTILLKSGFQQASDGRLFHAEPMSYRNMLGLSRLLGGDMVPLDPDAVVRTKSVESVEEALPRAVRDGIAWWWNNDWQRLAREIDWSVEASDDERGAELLADRQGTFVNHPERVRMWVHEALSREIHPATEPIIGMGLAYASQGISVEDYPEPWQVLRDELIELQGESQKPREASEPVNDTQALANELVNDPRPQPGSRVRFTDEAGATHRGVVQRRSEANDNELLLIPDEPRMVEGITVPQPMCVALDQIAPGDRPHNAESISQESASVRGEINAPRNPLINDDELLNERFRDRIERGELPPQRQAQMLKALARTPNGLAMNPASPLWRSSNAEQMESVLATPGALSRAFDVDEDSPVMLDLSRFLVEHETQRFNEAQPDTDPQAPAIAAVLPVGDCEGNVLAGAMTPDSLDRVAQDNNAYAVIWHPRFVEAMRDETAQWLERVVAYEAGNSSTEGTSALQMANASRRRNYLKQTHLKDLTEYEIRTGGEWPFGHYPCAISQNGSEELPAHEAARRLARLKDNNALQADVGLITKDLEQARRWVNAINNPSEKPDPNMVERNRRILNAIGDLAQVPSAQVEDVAHPLAFLVTRSAQMLGQRQDLASNLARFQIDIENQPPLINDLANAMGVFVNPLYRKNITESVKEPESIDAPYLRVNAAVMGLGVGSGNDWRLKTLVVRNESDDEADLVAGSLEQASMFGRQVTDATVTTVLAQAYADEWSGIKADSNMDMAEQALTHNEHMRADFSVNNLGDLSKRINNQVALARFSRTREPFSLKPNTSLTLSSDVEKRINEAVDEASQTLVHGLTSSEVRDAQTTEKLKSAIRAWAMEQPHIQAMNNPDRVIDNMASRMMEMSVGGEQNQGLVVFTRKSKNRIRYAVEPVTLGDVRKAEFDREEAFENVTMKARGMSRGNYKAAYFDSFAVLKPETRKALEALQKADEPQAQNTQNTGSSSKAKSRGKRQDKGVVAGLAQKDLRGSVSVVLGAIENAKAEDKRKMVTKTRLWESPDWEAMREPESDEETAMEPAVARFFADLRSELPARPGAYSKAAVKDYSEVMLMVRDLFNEVRTMEQLRLRLEDTLEPKIKEISDRGSAHERAIFGDKPGFVFHASDESRRRALDRKVNFCERTTEDNTRWPQQLASRAAASRRSGERVAVGENPDLEELKRVGAEDYRNNQEITEDQLIEEFGFSGVEYGNWMTQADRTRFLNRAYDSFRDLSKALNAQPKALSLGGSLGLAFGSRGKGGRNPAAAHYEPTNNVINLTRMNGAGSLAHEYGHALANYFARNITGVMRGDGDITRMIGSQNRITETEGSQVGNLRKEVYDAFATVMANVIYEPINPDAPENEPGWSLKQFSQSKHGAVNRDRESVLAKDARKADALQNRFKDPYWAQPHELFARTFETWVHRKVEKSYPEFRNDFLVRPDKLTRHDGGTDKDRAENPGSKDNLRLYPTGEQFDRIDQAMEHLVDTIKTHDISVEHEHLGETQLPVFYSQDWGARRVKELDQAALARCALTDIARMCGPNVLVSWHNEIQDDAGTPVPGRFRVLEGDSSTPGRSMRGLIDLANDAPMSTAYHEAFHYAQELLFTQAEQKILDESFAVGTPLHERLKDCMAEHAPGVDQQVLQAPHEAQAYAYQQWVKGNLSIEDEPRPQTLFGKIRDFCRDLAGIPRQHGFSQTKALFQSFYNGQIAQREALDDAGQAMRVSPQHLEQQQRKNELTGTDKTQHSGQHARDTAMAGEDTSDQSQEGDEAGAKEDETPDDERSSFTMSP